VYFVFAYAGLTIPGVGVAADYVGDFRAVLSCSIALAVLWALSAAGVVGPGRTGRPRGRVRAAAH